MLSGPQGTLFGASSQSGALRMITNKPVHGEFEAGFNAKYGGTKGGADSGAVDAYVKRALFGPIRGPLGGLQRQPRWLDRQRASHLHPQRRSDRPQQTRPATARICSNKGRTATQTETAQIQTA